MLAKKAEEKIWNHVNADLCVSATINNKDGKHNMYLMTMIDSASC